MQGGDRLRGRLRVLRHADFRNIWLAQSTSGFGDRLVIVALALFVTDLTGSATDVGLVLGAQTLPLVAFLLIGGVWADRLPRARVMLATDLIRAFLHGLLAVLIFLDAVAIWHLVVIEALFGAAEAFFRPAYTGLLPRTVPDDEMQEAQALSHLSGNLSELAGPAIATAVVLGVGAGWAFALDALTFLISACFLIRVRVQAPASVTRTLLSDLAEGFKEVSSRRWLWVTVAVFTFAVPLGYAPLFVLGPLVATNGYDSPALFGILTTLIGVGAIGGAVLGLRWRPRHPLRLSLILSLTWPLLLVAFGLESPIAILLVLGVAMGASFALFDVLWNTVMAEQIPPHALSRVSSYDWLGSLLLLPVGYIAAGPLAEATSAGAVLVIGGLLTAGLMLLGLVPRETRAL